MTGFGKWETLEQLEEELRKTAEEIEQNTGERPKEMTVGSDVAVALNRFGHEPNGIMVGRFAYIGRVAGIRLWTDLKGGKGCDGCGMGCKE